jgi:hypothetical protein
LAKKQELLIENVINARAIENQSFMIYESKLVSMEMNMKKVLVSFTYGEKIRTSGNLEEVKIFDLNL